MATNRGLLEAEFMESDGDIRASLSVTVKEPDGTTNIAQTMYSATSGGIVKANPLTTDSDGRIQVFVPVPQRIVLIPSGGTGKATAFYHDPADVVTLDETQSIIGRKTLSNSGKITFGSGVVDMLRGGDGVLRGYYGDALTDYTEAAFTEGSTGTPKATFHPSWRWQRIITPNPDDDGHVFPNYQFQTHIEGVIAASDTPGNTRFNNYGLVTSLVAATTATSELYTAIAFIAHASVSGADAVAKAAVNGANILCESGERGGQACEFETSHGGGNTQADLAWNDTSPSNTGTTGINIRGSARLTGSNHNGQAILFQAANPVGNLGSFNAGLRFMPGSIRDLLYAIWMPGISGVGGYNARTILVPNAVPALWAMRAGGASPIGLIMADGVNRTAVLNDSVIVMQNTAGTATYATFSTGALTVNNGAANAQSLNIRTLTELTTIAAAATTDTALQMPAGAIVLAVSVLVTVIIPTAATFTVGDSGSAARFNTGSNVAVAAGTTDKGTKAGAYYNASALAIRITPDLTPANNSGRVRVTIHYLESTPPTT